jgi:serine/threonine protein kinase
MKHFPQDQAPPVTAGLDVNVPTPPPAAETAASLPAVPGYEILEMLGRGGMGVVYRARHLALKRTVALKMILAGGHAGTDERARFQGEVQAVARLSHPNIVQIYEVGEHEGLPFCALEFVAGQSLAQKLDGNPCAPMEAARLVETLAAAVHAAHMKEVVHRDLKPANVLLAWDGTPKITDFGLAKKLDEARHTASGAVVGTPSYMAPEQARGQGKVVGPAADIYALGAILYECVTGRPPFQAATALDTMRQVVEAEPVPPTELNPKVPRDLESICLCCLQKEPEKRYPSASALAEDLRRFRSREPIRARRTGNLKRATRWAKRRPVAVLLLATVLGIFVAGFLAGRYVWTERAGLPSDRGQTAARGTETKDNFKPQATPVSRPDKAENHSLPKEPTTKKPQVTRPIEYPAPVPVQPTATVRPKVLFTYNPKTPPTEADDMQKRSIVLRPNREQSVYLYAYNPGPDIMKNVTVKVAKLLPDNSTQMVGQVTVPLLRVKQPQQLVFGKPEPPVPPGKPVPPWPELDGPPFRFAMSVEEAGAKEEEISKWPVAIKIMEPIEYMSASDANYDIGAMRFSVWITAGQYFLGPPANVQLVLSPDVIPGLIPTKAGTYKQVIMKAGDKVQLVAERIQFRGLPPRQGRVYVTVDGFERAFIFNNSFTEGAPRAIARGTRARIVAPRFAVPGGKYPVTVEVDDPPTGGGFVELGFDRAGNKQFTVQSLPGFREQHVYFVPEGPKGGLTFKTYVQDWVKEQDTAEVYGKRWLRVQLFALNPKTGDRGELANIVDEGPPAEDAHPPFTTQPRSIHAPLVFDMDTKAVEAEIILDPTPPEDVAFVGWPEQLAKNAPLILKATGHDDESGISKVTFFLGQPVDGQPPPKAVGSPARQVDPKAPVWRGELPLPTGQAGRFDVCVQFTNGAGRSTTEGVTIELTQGSKEGLVKVRAHQAGR